MKHQWSIYQGTRCIEVGVISADSARDALRDLMKSKQGELEDDKLYRFVVGDFTASSYGDELAQTSFAMGSESSDRTGPSGHLHEKCVWIHGVKFTPHKNAIEPLPNESLEEYVERSRALSQLHDHILVPEPRQARTITGALRVKPEDSDLVNDGDDAEADRG